MEEKVVRKGIIKLLCLLLDRTSTDLLLMSLKLLIQLSVYKEHIDKMVSNLKFNYFKIYSEFGKYLLFKFCKIVMNYLKYLNHTICFSILLKLLKTYYFIYLIKLYLHIKYIHIIFEFLYLYGFFMPFSKMST